MTVHTVWHVAHVSPLARSADRVEQFIARLGHQCWWPKLTEIRKRPLRGGSHVRGARGGRRWTHDAIERPLFPSYVLVSLPRIAPPVGRFSDREAHAIGLFGLLCTTNGPAIVPDDVVADLQRREAAGEFNLTQRHGRKIIAKRATWLVPGGKVMIDDGPFRGFTAAIEELVAPDRARVSLSVFGRQTSLHIDADQLAEHRR